MTAPSLRVVCALDSFKGSLSSDEACAAARAGVLDALPGADVVSAPLADGGEGTVAAMAARGRLSAAPTHTLLGEPIEAPVAVLPEAIVLESAAMLSLAQLGAPTPSAARAAHSWGLGEQLASAGRAFAPRRALIGLGGTGITDGGVGFLLALGAQMWDAQGNPLPRSLAELAGNPLLLRPVEVSLPPRPAWDLIGLADVRAPLLGPAGAARVFGPQKGADAALVEELEDAMEGWARALADAGADVAHLPGAGAAGGLGAAILALEGTLEPGLRRIAAETGAMRHLAEADLVLTGEGRVDGQTGMGKLPAEVGALAKESAAPGHSPVVVALAGTVEGHPGGPIDAAVPIHAGPLALAEAMRPDVAAAAIRESAARVTRLVVAARG